MEPEERAVTALNGAEFARIRVKEKKSLVFFSKYFGITHGFKAHLLNIRNDRESGPEYLSTATLAFTTKHINAGGNSSSREKRALFGEHGCVSGTLRRSAMT